MDNHPEDEGRGGRKSRLLILIGICFLAGGLLGPTVADLMPADGFAIFSGSTNQGHFRLIPAEESDGHFQIDLMLVGVVLIFTGTILWRRGR